MNSYNSQSSPVQSSPVQSVIIPTYNRKDMLAETISSVLKQTQKSLEVIVVDDCSTDGTEDFMKTITDERVRYIRCEKNRGVELNLSYALGQIRGEFVSFIAQDDYYTDYDFFSKAIKIFDEHKNDSEPLVFVAANASWLFCNTGEMRQSDIGEPGRVKGIDYILKGNEYRKPYSTFPTVFRTETLRKAGFEHKMMFDTPTYYQAALFGDAWYIPDVIGVYRFHNDSLTLGYKHHPELEGRHYITVHENIKQWRFVRETLYNRVSHQKADSWYISGMLMLNNFYALSRPKLKDRMKVTAIILQESGFMPSLWKALMYRKSYSLLRNITPLRKFYRFLKYKCRGRPYPEDN